MVERTVIVKKLESFNQITKGYQFHDGAQLRDVARQGDESGFSYWVGKGRSKRYRRDIADVEVRRKVGKRLEILAGENVYNSCWR